MSPSIRNSGLRKKVNDFGLRPVYMNENSWIFAQTEKAELGTAVASEGKPLALPEWLHERLR